MTIKTILSKYMPLVLHITNTYMCTLYFVFIYVRMFLKTFYLQTSLCIRVEIIFKELYISILLFSALTNVSCVNETFAGLVSKGNVSANEDIYDFGYENFTGPWKGTFKECLTKFESPSAQYWTYVFEWLISLKLVKISPFSPSVIYFKSWLLLILKS